MGFFGTSQRNIFGGGGGTAGMAHQAVEMQQGLQDRRTQQQALEAQRIAQFRQQSLTNPLSSADTAPAFQQAMGQQYGALGKLAELFYGQGGIGAAGSQYTRLAEGLDPTGGQRATDIRSAYARERSGVMQGLARSGMGGTTVAPTMGLGVTRERESSLNRLAEEMTGQRLGVMQARESLFGGLAGMLGKTPASMEEAFGLAGLGGALSGEGQRDIQYTAPTAPEEDWRTKAGQRGF